MLTGSNLIWLMIAVYVGIPLVWLTRVVRAYARNQRGIQSSWSDLDVALMRKHDLILKMVETARPLVDSDRNLASNVTHLRELAEASRWNIEVHAYDEQRLDKALNALIAGAKQNLNGSADLRFFRDLHKELTASGRHIQVAGSCYNVAAHRYNTMLKTFPYSIIGRRLHLRPRPLYDSKHDGRQAKAAAGARKR